MVTETCKKCGHFIMQGAWVVNGWSSPVFEYDGLCGTCYNFLLEKGCWAIYRDIKAVKVMEDMGGAYLVQPLGEERDRHYFIAFENELLRVG